MGLFETIEQSRQAMLAGRVREEGSGTILDQPGVKPKKNLKVVIEQPDRFVSRGGLKLDGFLDVAGLDLRGMTVIDVGSSTGGFTDCCLQRGASKVIAVDVGTHQLHEKLRADSRVELWENQDIRGFDWKGLGQTPRLAVIDVSFISLKLIIPEMLKALPSVPLIMLFKPQFELNRDVPKARGVAPPGEAERGLEEMLLFLKGLGLNIRMVQQSAVKGSKGNQETFIWAEALPPKHIFRTYDIRGHADRDLSDEVFFALGFCYGKRLESRLQGAGRVGVGRDSRVSSPRLFKSFALGLKASGQKVVYLGEVPTPMTYFAHYQLGLDGVVQITASHNPAQDNGIKMMMLKDTLFGDEIVSFYDEIQAVKVEIPLDANPIDEDLSVELREKYLAFLQSSFSFKRSWNLALDCGNGMVGKIAREVFGAVSSSLNILFEQVDCRFPNHEADPTVERNLKDLQAEVARSRADLGFAFDGDGDRLGLITSRGRILWGDEIVMLLSELVLKRQPGATVIGEVKCSQKLFRLISDRGGQPVMYKTGHSLIKKRMKELKAPLAGEMSGHLFFADRFFGFDDATYAALRVLEVVDELGLDLDQWIESFPRTIVTPEIRIECREEEKAGLVDRALRSLSQTRGVEVSTIDGIRAHFPDGSWALVRASNTQAVIVVRVESHIQSRVTEILEILQTSMGLQARLQ
jgi:phosphomannomutase/phosphoglucomutase